MQPAMASELAGSDESEWQEEYRTERYCVMRQVRAVEIVWLTLRLQNCKLPDFRWKATAPDAGVEVGYCLFVQPLRNHQTQSVTVHVLNFGPAFARWPERA